MARKKKTTEKESPSEQIVSQEDVWNVLNFANSIYNGIYTPDLMNSRMKDITMQPLVATLDKINTALSNPKSSENELIGYSEWLELNSILYRRILLYFFRITFF